MLVPSTFTGWYRKMMMKAEIASEITKSRSHTASTGTLRCKGLTGAALFQDVFDDPGDAIPDLILVRNVPRHGG
jgi:hypothetical protein